MNKINFSDNFKFNFLIFIITTFLVSIITMELLKYSGYHEADSALVKKVSGLALLLKESNEHNEELSNEVHKLEKEIFELKHSIWEINSSDKVKEMYMLAGLTDITGSGAIINISDNETFLKKNKNYANTLQSDDLLRMVNVLKSAGATAISINNQRLVVTSEITNADNNIIINKQKISHPYTIKVIGDFNTINSALNIRGGIVEYLKLFNISVDIKKENKITINSF